MAAHLPVPCIILCKNAHYMPHLHVVSASLADQKRAHTIPSCISSAPWTAAS